MKTLAIKYPESVLATLNLSPETFEQEARVALAVKLYVDGTFDFWPGCGACRNISCRFSLKLSALWRGYC